MRRDPFDAAVVRRYKAILARDPHDARALGELVTLYRRHRTVATLEAEYRKELGSAEDWAKLVVLAQLPRASPAESLALWKRALAARPDDARGWLAIGDLATDVRAARDAYRQAVKHAASPRDQRLALTKLVGAAKSSNDATTLDAAYAELLVLAPKDGTLWLDRGSAQLAAGRLPDAIASLATAESLLASDPERRLTAMMNQGVALERLGRVDDAIAQYAHTLDKLPRGYYLGREIVARIIDAERRRKQLAAAIDLLDKRWPERSRGHFEWSTLADLYKEAGDDERALAAYKRAVAKAPTEIDTQRKLIALLDKLHADDALVQHEAAARIAPGDADLQLELAKRYYPIDHDKAFATLERLSRRLANNVNVRRAIAELYMKWEQPRRAIVEYAAIVALEPNEPDHALVLGESYWQLGDTVNARAAWQRLAAIGTPAAWLRYGEVMTTHEQWNEAVVGYTQLIALDATNVDAWRGRARANEALQHFADAVADAGRAVALIGVATREEGQRERHLLVRVLGSWYASAAGTQLPDALARWRFAFEHGDIAAGYLLVAHHTRLGSPQLHDVLVELYRRVPTDDSLGIALARSYSRRKEFKRARKQLRQIAQRTPKRKEEIDDLVVQVDKEERWDDAGGNDRVPNLRGGATDLVGRRRRFGMRLGVGTDIRNATGAVLDLGMYRTYGIGRATALVTRLDWTKRDDDMESVNAFAMSIGLTRRIVGARKFELAAGVAQRVELRYGYDPDHSAWNRAGMGADVIVEVLPRALPATLGARFHQTITDASHSSALLVELAFEVR
ncbi:MAG TPA: tetratricopeptide repeat protein [Kofleriaceae bacterium]